MVIRVMYHDKKYDMVKASALGELIVAGKIKKFLRSDGWATIGISPIRGFGGNYEGAERRILSQQYLASVE